MESWDREEVWNAIHELSDIRGRYNLFSKKQRPKYHACCLAIRALRQVIGEPIEGYEEDKKDISIESEPTDDKTNI